MALPNAIHEQKELLTLNTNELPIFKDALIPGVDVQPLFLDPHNGVWVLRVIFAAGVILPTHYHTGTVHLFTLSGCWNYSEYPDQPQTAGSYLYEPGGSIHQFTTPASNTELTETLMVVTGANVNFDPAGNYMGIMDASDIAKMLAGLVRSRGLEPAKYITPPVPRYTTDA